MATKIADVMVSATVFLNTANASQVEDLKARRDTEALEYLRQKFSGKDDKVFRTDYTGREGDHVVDVAAVLKAKHIEQTCADCKGECSLPDGGKPVINVDTDQRGFEYLRVDWTPEITCTHKQAKEAEANLDRLFPRSGLLPKQRACTFRTYKTENDELKNAYRSATQATKNGSNLILAGRWGTGKTHLAIAIALNVMGGGRQAIFRVSNEMANELREANIAGGYYDLMRQFSEVPCLVIDDLGKDRCTEAWCDYLAQIINYRDTHDLQTIVTTNATTPEELGDWYKTQYIQPILSRLLGRGEWVSIKRSEDYRMRRV